MTVRLSTPPLVFGASSSSYASSRKASTARVRPAAGSITYGTQRARRRLLLVDTGLADHFLPELSGLKLEIDEHAQHKDVYEHTLTVVSNAVALEEAEPPAGGGRPGG